MLDEIARLDPDMVRTLFDPKGAFRRTQPGGDYVAEFHTDLQVARETGPVHVGSVEQVLAGIRPGPHSSLPDDGVPVFSVFGYDTVNEVFRSPERFDSSMMRGTFETFGPNILGMDGVEHSRLRAVTQSAFARNMMHWWVDRWVTDITDTLLTRIGNDGRAELNLQFCALLPLLTITSSFGVPVDDALRLREIIERMIARAHGREAALAAAVEAEEILLPQIKQRRVEPRDDMLTKIVQEAVVEENGERRPVTDDEALAYARLLLTAGSGTTWRQLAITLWALLNAPDQLDAVRRDRKLVRAAIEESLRWEVTDPTFFRRAVVDTTLGGVDIPAGSRMSLCLTAANHDPARWPDPERFDVHRKLKPHLSFATGAHVCLGMHLARAEMTVAINAILDRLPNLRWDPDVPRPVLMGLHMRGPTHLPVVFG